MKRDGEPFLTYSRRVEVKVAGVIGGPGAGGWGLGFFCRLNASRRPRGARPGGQVICTIPNEP